MQSLKINLLRITGARPFTAKDGTQFLAIPIKANGVYVTDKAQYLELTLIPNRDGPGQHGDDGFVTVNLSREQREAGEKGPIVGNWRHLKRAAATPPPVESATVPDDGDDIPF
jgi:hypothetical protein